MADLLREITDTIDKLTALTVGTTLFAYAFPAEKADTAVAVLDGPGMPVDKKPLAAIGQYDIQILSRSREPATAKSNALAVQAALHQLYEVDLGSEWHAYGITAKQAPYPLGVDSLGRMEYANHYRVQAAPIARS